jgi:hypothetical protein
VFQFRSQRKYQSGNVSLYRSKYLVTAAMTVAVAIAATAVTMAATAVTMAATTVATKVAVERAACVVAAAKVA